MRILAALFGLAAIGLGAFFQTMPETQGCGNGFIIACGITSLVYSVGVVSENRPAPAPAEKRLPEPEIDEIEAAYQLGREAEYLWRSGKDPRSHVKAAAQVRAYGYKNRPDLAEAFLSGMEDKFKRAILIGAKIITEHERA